MRGLIAKQLGYDMGVWDNVGRLEGEGAHLPMIMVSRGGTTEFRRPNMPRIACAAAIRTCRDPIVPRFERNPEYRLLSVICAWLHSP